MLKNHSIPSGLLVLLLGILLLATPALAAEFNVIATDLELKSEFENEWDNSIEAQDDDTIDVRLTVFLGATGSDTPDAWPIIVQAKVWGLSQSDNWELLTETGTSIFWIEVGEEDTFSWFDVFTASDYFEEYRVEGFAGITGPDESINAYITSVVKETRCQDIEIQAHNVFVGENDSETISFEVVNDTEETFFVDSVSLQEDSNYFSVQKKDFDEEIESGEVGEIKFKVNSESVSENKTDSVTVRVSGHFDSLSCSSQNIGEETFSVTIQNGGTASSSACNSIRAFTFPTTLVENTIQYKNFSVVNESDERFFVTEAIVESSTSSFSIVQDFFDSVLNAFSEGITRVQITANDVSSPQTETAVLQIRGEFEDGPDCDFGEIGAVSFPVTVQAEPQSPACTLLTSERHPISLGENDSRTFVYRIQNNSNERFDIDDVDLSKSSSSFDVEEVSFPSSIGDYQTGEFLLRASTDDLENETETVFAIIEVKGEFENGLDCGFNETIAQIPVILELDQESDNGDKDSPFCSKIDLDTDSVALDGGESTTQEFFIENNSEETFFVDGVNAYDNSTGVTVNENSFDDLVSPGERASVWVSIQANNTSATLHKTGFLKVWGHFNEGERCGSSSIGTKSFSITVNSGSSASFEGNECSAIDVSVPASQYIQQTGTISFSVTNSSNHQAFVALRGTDLTISPNSFSIPSQTTKTYSTTIQYYNTSSTRLEYLVLGQNCQGHTKYTTIYGSLAPPVSPSGLLPAPVPVGSDIQIVTAPSQIVFVNRTTVIATVKNNAPVHQTIQTRLDGFSPNWSADSISLGFEPFESKTVFLDVYSNNNYGTFTGTLIAETTGQKALKALRLSSVEVLGFGNDFVIGTQVQRTGNQTIEISAKLESQFSQQMRGTASLETINGAIIKETTFILNPNTKKTIVFGLQASETQSFLESVNIRVILDDGRSSLQTISLQGTSGGQGFGWDGIGTAFVSFGGDEWTMALLIILIIMVIAAIWFGLQKPRAPYQMSPTKGNARIPGVKNAVLVEPAPAPLTPTNVVTQETTTTTEERAIETSPTLAKPPQSSEEERFWFLKE
ncbi:hypothetical protein KKE06_04665 [Candidatus Micrarchaeota archaeon]|nr:hypothetical protein [Candidatus Micrarchaeota archaeon]MBU1930728.1 hypothetical protein [Candidatus Micrarchaeota archaeon]